jgi:ubiquinone/menaquinone biosynthesis C-methylase UbiE
MVNHNMTQFIDPSNKYTQTQQEKYNQLAEFDSANYDFATSFLHAHNNYEDYRYYLWKDIPDLHTKDVLDFGCGPGRNLTFYANTFKSIDGVDLAAGNLELAKRWIAQQGLDPNKFKLYKNDGVSLNGIPDASYDIIMSTICLQHISVHEIRYQLMKEFYRVLRPGGYFTAQFLLTADKPGTVKYYDNFYDASDSNGSHDCVVEDPENLKSDLEKIGFTNFHSYIRIANDGRALPGEDQEWLFANVQKPL